MAKGVFHITLNTMNFPDTVKPTHFCLSLFRFLRRGWRSYLRPFTWKIDRCHVTMDFPQQRKKRFLFYPRVYIASLCWHRSFLEPKRRRQTSSVSFIASTHSSCVATYVGGTSRAANRSAQASIWRFQCVSRLPSLWSQQRGPLPAIAADQTSHGRNYMVLAAGFGCGCSVFVTTCHYVLHRARR